jgi:hypothetical protein
MNMHDQVSVKKTVFATPWFDDEPIEIKAGWEGAIVDRPDGSEPAIEFYDETVTCSISNWW